MSIRAMQWAWDQDIARAGEKLVLLALADHAGDDLTCFPSSGSLAEKTGLSARTVREYIDSLEARGLVVKQSRKKRANGTFGPWVYRLVQRRPAASGDEAPQVTDHSASGDRSPPPVATGPRAEPPVEPSVNQPPNPPLDTASVRDQIVERAGMIYTKHQIDRGVRVRNPSGFADHRVRELREHERDRIDELVARAERCASAGQTLDLDVLAAVLALPDDESVRRRLAAVHPDPALDHSGCVACDGTGQVETPDGYVPCREPRRAGAA